MKMNKAKDKEVKLTDTLENIKIVYPLLYNPQ